MGTAQPTGDTVADTHDDPNAAPMHHDIRPDFTSAQVTIAAVLGVVAIVAGIVFGVALANN